MSFKKLLFKFIDELNYFNYEVDYSDFIWNFIFQDNEEKWYKIHSSRYQQTYYISHIDGETCSLDVDFIKKTYKKSDSFGFSSFEGGYNEPDVVWTPILKSALKWFKFVKRDWIKANKQVYENYPLNRRFGIVANSLVRESLKDIYKIDEKLGAVKVKKFIQIVEFGYFRKDENVVAETISANDFFSYCKLAYTAVMENTEGFDPNLSGCEMYKRYADGRHNGLLNIDFTSEQEFSDWIDGKHPKHDTGGHPWEIMRGGNATHIDLYVRRPNYSKEGFKIELNAPCIQRLEEAVQMFLAIYDAKLPISIYDADGIRKRLLAMDNIGIVPSYGYLHRGNQHFKKEQCVYDVIYYDDLSRYKRRITPFITWEPLPILKPNCINK